MSDSYILTEADVFDGKNRLGMSVAHLPLGVPLCGSCDHPIPADGYCLSCEEWRVEVTDLGDGTYRVAA